MRKDRYTKMCRYCCSIDDDKKLSLMKNINGTVSLFMYSDGEATLRIKTLNDTLFLSTKFKYCPMCGRKMGEQE